MRRHMLIIASKSVSTMAESMLDEHDIKDRDSSRGVWNLSSMTGVDIHLYILRKCITL